MRLKNLEGLISMLVFILAYIAAIAAVLCSTNCTPYDLYLPSPPADAALACPTDTFILTEPTPEPDIGVSDLLQQAGEGCPGDGG